jgi:hypothetical protein
MSKKRSNKSNEVQLTPAEIQEDVNMEHALITSNESSVEAVYEEVETSTETSSETLENVQTVEPSEPFEIPSDSIPTENVSTEVNEPDPFWVPGNGNLAVQPAVQNRTDEFIETARTFQTQSARVRWLTKQGLTRGQIVKIYPGLYGRTILYQHVRNILVTPVKNVG